MHGIIGSLFDDPVRGFVLVTFMFIAAAVLRSLAGLAFFQRERKAGQE